MRLLNLGCGAHYHADWVNVDIAPDSPQVLAVDLGGELPFREQSFDAAYCSHVLEHLAPADAAALLRRIHGLLKPGGILRVVVPDLEALARAYLELLDQFRRDPRAGEARAADYDWILLELFDQVARSEGGGGMVRFMADTAPRNAEFIRARVGAEAYAALQAAARGVWHQSAPPRLRQRFAAARRWLAGAAVAAIGGAAARRAYAEGLFRQSGEVHRWMYDGYSMARALRAAGFANAAPQTAFASGIPGFARYQLDVDAEGAVRKPDSLFMEAARA
jgi:SAM-dependent methyltransferase